MTHLIQTIRSLAQSPDRLRRTHHLIRLRPATDLYPVVRLPFQRLLRATTLNALFLITFAVSTSVAGGWFEAVEPPLPAPGLRLKDLNGVAHDLSQIKGKTVLINFWTTWCPPCIEEMPSLIRLNEEMKQSGLVILAVNVEESKRHVSKIAARLKLDFPVLLDSNRVAGNAWKVKVFPSSFLVDAQGLLRYRAIGPVAWDSDEVTSIIYQVLQE